MKKVRYCYPPRVRWYLDLTNKTDPLFPFGKHTRKKIASTQRKLVNSIYRIQFEPVNPAFISAFDPIYQSFLIPRGVTGRSLQDKLIDHPTHSFPYYSFSLYKEKELVGALVFSDRKNYLAIAVRVLPRSLSIKLPISIAYVFESLINDYALTRHYTYLLHGSDHNWFGKYVSIGLANYKLSIGCLPFVGKDMPTAELSSLWDRATDMYVFLQPEKGERITNALYMSTHITQLQIGQKYPALLHASSPKVQIVR